MARGKKTGGKDFQPGHAGGPGRPPTPEDLKTARMMNRDQLERTLNKYINHSFNELVAIMKDPSTTVFDLAICKILAETIKKGDQQRMSFILKFLDLEPHQKIKADVTGNLHATLVEMINKLEGE